MGYTSVGSNGKCGPSGLKFHGNGLGPKGLGRPLSKNGLGSGFIISPLLGESFYHLGLVSITVRLDNSLCLILSFVAS